MVNASGYPAAHVRIAAVPRASDKRVDLPATGTDGRTLYEHAPRGDYDLFVVPKGLHPKGGNRAAAYRKAWIAVGACVAVPDAAELHIQLPKAAGY